MRIKIILTSILLSTIAASCAKESSLVPFALHKAVIVADGNSLTYGQSFGTPYTDQLAAMPPFDSNGATIYNFGVNGQQTIEMMSDAATQVDLLINHQVKNILVAWEITNDIYYNGNAANALFNLKKYCLTRKAAGWDKVIVIGVLPRLQEPSLTGSLIGYGGTAADYSAKLTEADDSLRLTWSAFADAYIDVRADSRLTDLTNSKYFIPDHIHLTTAGMGIIAGDVRDKILAF